MDEVFRGAILVGLPIKPRSQGRVGEPGVRHEPILPTPLKVEDAGVGVNFPKLVRHSRFLPARGRPVVVIREHALLVLRGDDLLQLEVEPDHVRLVLSHHLNHHRQPLLLEAR